MQRDYLVEKILFRKKQLGWTINRMSIESNVGARTINRVLAKQDVRISSIEAILSALKLNITVNTLEVA